MTGYGYVFLLVSTLGYGAGANWVEHKDPKGFVVKHPPGWVVESSEKDMVVVHDPTGAVQAIAYGFMTKPDISSRQWLEQQFPARFGTRFQQVRMEPIAQRSRGQSTVLLKYSSLRSGDGRASVLCSLYNGAGMMFAIATPLYRFDEFKRDLVGILQTFTITGPSRTSGGGIEWVRWTDPVEHAYSLEVPKGWKVEGGAFRRSAIDVHAWNRFTSPDGQTVIFSSDRDLPGMFQVPNQINTKFKSPGQNVAQYQTGAVFAEGWARRIGGGGIQVKDKRPLEELNKAAAKRNAAFNTGVSQKMESFGEVSFTTGDKAGYVAAGTSITRVQGADLVSWFVTYLAGFLCPLGKAPATMAIGTHILNSNKVSEAWFYGQQKTTAATSKIIAETSDYVSKVRSESYWSQQASRDRTNRNFDDYIRDVQRVVDPETGRQYEAVSGSNYYYRVHTTDAVVGTNSTEVPRMIDVTQLIPVK
jgi:hypothetical protein